MKLGSILKFTVIVGLFFSGKSQISSSSCQLAQNEETDFVCGNLPLPEAFQPCANFTSVKGRSTTATTLWFLGEAHDREQETADCVNKITKNMGKHTVYSESVEAGKMFSCKFTAWGEKPGRSCVGWDNLKAHKKLGEVDKDGTYGTLWKDSYILMLKDVYYKGQEDYTKYVPEKFAHHLKLMRSDLESPNKQQKNTNILTVFTDRKIGIEAINAILKLYEQGQSFTEIFSNIESNNKPSGSGGITLEQFHQLKKLHGKRNKKMIETAKKHPTNQVAIFVAGVDHLTKSEERDDADSTYTQEQLMEFATENRFAILAKI